VPEIVFHFENVQLSLAVAVSCSVRC
jgi:hypothetical protein